MTKLGVMTDSHRAWHNIERALEDMKDCAYILHLGDHDSDMDDFPDVSKRLVSVAGNCDLFSMQPGRRFLTVENVRILLTHGDGFHVKRNLSALLQKSLQEGCALALYGHTHEKTDVTEGSVRMINPGALRDGRYAVVTIDGSEISAEFRVLEK